MRAVTISSLLVTSVMALGGCSKKPPEPGPAPPPGQNANPPPAAPGSSSGTGAGVAATDNLSVSPENFRRLRNGMTQAEVEQILGLGLQVSRTELVRALRSNRRPGRTDSTVLKWQNGRDTLFVELLARSGVVAGWYITEKPDGTISYDLLGAVTPPGRP